jgi:hypothetical protein
MLAGLESFGQQSTSADGHTKEAAELGRKRINMNGVHVMEKVESVGELISEIEQRIRRDERILWFRGQRRATQGVEPSIERGYSNDDERNFTNRFRSRAGTRYEELPKYNDFAAWLSLMQHYGLPTRLLDWTRSPLIALYFALEKYIYEDVKEQDACIWILEPHILNKIEGFGEVTPSIDAHMCRKMLRPAFSDKGTENNKVMAVMAAETDERMFVQQGCFTIHSYKGPLDKRSDNREFLSGFIIPANRVRDMAFSIDVCGFRKGDIFPDLEHLANEFKGRCRPKR